MLSFRLENRELYNKKQEYGTLQMISASFLSAERGWMHKKRFLEQYEMLYVKKGALHFALGAQVIDMVENQLFICPSFSTVRGTRKSESNVEFYCVDFQTNSLGSAQITTTLHTVISSSRMLQRLEELVAAFRRHRLNPEIPEAHLLLILEDLRRDLRGDAEASYVLAERVAHYIAENLSKPLTAESIAKDMSYDRDYLGRVLKQVYGTSLKQLVNQRKLESAKTLLRSSSYSIGEIGFMLGFEDSNLFTKFFVYHVGMPATRYRRLSV